ncbi:hypothetical protein JTE90_022403 [Oedothorax gibbosus]|uniref:Uncharacterized protein n=1 Tax=Oedothorax gibbosus TaxID=931172 RepID=A0AAV6TZI4_9ARAC|nr:hypothetical protein JTE90_022403 [Oedothorax gibbosus]
MTFTSLPPRRRKLRFSSSRALHPNDIRIPKHPFDNNLLTVNSSPHSTANKSLQHNDMLTPSRIITRIK